MTKWTNFQICLKILISKFIGRTAKKTSTTLFKTFGRGKLLMRRRNKFILRLKRLSENQFNL